MTEWQGGEDPQAYVDSLKPPMTDIVERLRIDADRWMAGDLCRDNEESGLLADEAADIITTLRADKAALREHISEQIEHVKTRIQDGTEIGATVWRIALEDVAAENARALLERTSHAVK